MKINFRIIAIAIYSIFLIIGCSRIEQNEIQNNPDDFIMIREAAWMYIEDKGWSRHTKEEWDKATVRKIIADHRFKSYEGKEIVIVYLEDAINSPTIIVDPDTKQVIGHIPGE